MMRKNTEINEMWVELKQDVKKHAQVLRNEIWPIVAESTRRGVLGLAGKATEKATSGVLTIAQKTNSAVGRAMGVSQCVLLRMRIFCHSARRPRVALVPLASFGVLVAGGLLAMLIFSKQEPLVVEAQAGAVFEIVDLASEAETDKDEVEEEKVLVRAEFVGNAPLPTDEPKIPAKEIVVAAHIPPSASPTRSIEYAPSRVDSGESVLRELSRRRDLALRTQRESEMRAQLYRQRALMQQQQAQSLRSRSTMGANEAAAREMRRYQQQMSGRMAARGVRGF